MMNLFKLFTLAILSSFLFGSCFPGAPAETIDEEIVELKGTKWQLIDRYGLDAKIEFDNKMEKLSGYNGCNTFSADITLKNYFIEFNNFVNTERYCEDLDNFDRDFLVALSKVRDYTVSKNNLSMQTLGVITIGERRDNTLNFKRIE